MQIFNYKKEIIIFLGVILFGVSIFYSITKFERNIHDGICEKYSDYLRMKLSAIVIKKEVLYKNHGQTCLYLKNFKTDTIILFNVDTSFWNNVQIGDSVYKKFNEDIIYDIGQENGITKTYAITFGCPSNQRSLPR